MKQFALCAFADEAGASMREQITALRENGIGRIELRGVDGRNHTELTADEMRTLRARLADEGISVWALGSPIGKISIRDEFQPHMELFRHTLELAHAAGAQNIRMFSFYLPAAESAQWKGAVIDRLGRMVELAQSAGITLCHENEKGIYGDIPARCRDLHEALPGLKSVFDPANFVQCGADTLGAWDQLAEFIHYMHIKNAKSEGEIVPAGEGAANIPELLRRYAAQGGEVLTLEPHLFEFAGLQALEQEGDVSEIGQRYESQRAAFDHGVNALKNLI